MISIDQSKPVVIMFMDLSLAFDTVDRNLCTFQSYSEPLSQCVCVCFHILLCVIFLFSGETQG